jgi:DNA-binding response OmpR family regulator
VTEPGRGANVLVVDDEPSIRAIVRGFLERDGHRVEEAVDGPSAVEAARNGRPDVIVLDIMLPGFDGLEVLRQVRAFADPMVLMLTARSEEIDRVVGLTVGADDYLAKPFSPRELAARVVALLRRRRAPAVTDGRVLEAGELRLDTAARTVTFHGHGIEATTLEFDLLAALCRDPGVVVTRHQLLDAAWGIDYFGDDHVLDVHVANLRRKLAAAGPEVAESPIETVRGVGYRVGRSAR